MNKIRSLNHNCIRKYNQSNKLTKNKIISKIQTDYKIKDKKEERNIYNLWIKYDLWITIAYENIINQTN